MVTLLALVAGALTQAQAVVAPAVRDSAGITIIAHGRLAERPAPLTIGETPLLLLGGPAEPLALELQSRNPFPVARPLASGRWVVLDWLRLIVYGPDGRPAQSVGRGGRGPGEFGQLRGLCVTPGDSIVAIGYSDRRVSAFGPSGEHLRTSIAPGPVWSDACFPDGSILVRTEYAPNPRSRLPRREAAVVDLTFEGRRFDWRSGTSRPLGAFPAESRDLMIPDIGNAVVTSTWIVAGNGSRPEIELRAHDGRLVRLIRWSAAARSVSAPMREGSVGRVRPSGPPSPRREMPSYRTIKADSQRLWVEEYPAPGERRATWWLFSITGDYLGRLILPAPGAGRPEVTWVDGDRVMLTWRDVDGSIRFSLHPLHPTGQAPAEDPRLYHDSLSW